jgi:exosortase/archaeosortase family protein
VILRSAAHSFHVIDGCSGLQGIATLTLVAVMIRELLASSALRVWLIVAIAPALGYALNAVRIAYIAASPNPEAYAGLQGDHTPQGLALLAAGTGILYALGRTLAGGGPLVVESHGAGSRAPWRLGAAGLAALAVLSVSVSPFPPANTPAATAAFPERGAGWESEPLTMDPFFLGLVPAGQSLYRRYQMPAESPPRPLDLFVGTDTGVESAASQLLSSKLAWPGPEFRLESRSRTRIWMVDQDAELSVAAQGTGPERAVIYTWRLRYEGLLRESLRALLALDSSPFRRSAPRAVVRLVAFAPFDEPLAVSRAKQRLDRFIAAFRDEFAAL